MSYYIIEKPNKIYKKPFTGRRVLCSETVLRNGMNKYGGGIIYDSLTGKVYFIPNRKKQSEFISFVERVRELPIRSIGERVVRINIGEMTSNMAVAQIVGLMTLPVGHIYRGYRGVPFGAVPISSLKVPFSDTTSNITFDPHAPSIRTSPSLIDRTSNITFDPHAPSVRTSPSSIDRTSQYTGSTRSQTSSDDSDTISLSPPDDEKTVRIKHFELHPEVRGATGKGKGAIASQRVNQCKQEAVKELENLYAKLQAGVFKSTAELKLEKAKKGDCVGLDKFIDNVKDIITLCNESNAQFDKSINNKCLEGDYTSLVKLIEEKAKELNKKALNIDATFFKDKLLRISPFTTVKDLIGFQEDIETIQKTIVENKNKDLDLLKEIYKFPKLKNWKIGDTLPKNYKTLTILGLLVILNTYNGDITKFPNPDMKLLEKQLKTLYKQYGFGDNVKDDYPNLNFNDSFKSLNLIYNIIYQVNDSITYNITDIINDAYQYIRPDMTGMGKDIYKFHTIDLLKTYYDLLKSPIKYDKEQWNTLINSEKKDISDSTVILQRYGITWKFVDITFNNIDISNILKKLVQNTVLFLHYNLMEDLSYIISNSDLIVKNKTSNNFSVKTPEQKQEYIKKLTILNQKLDEILNINARISCKPNPNYRKNINDITKLLSDKIQCMEKRIEELNKINFV